MAFSQSIPHEFKIVDATAGCVTTNGGVTGKYASLKYAHRATLILSFTQAVGHATVVTIRQAKTVAGGDVKDITIDIPVWANEDTAATDTLVKQANAKTFTVANDIKKKQVVFEIDPSTLDLANEFDVVGFTVSDSSQATNFVSGIWVLNTRYAQVVPPSAIVD